MQITFYADSDFERWDHRSPDDPGIGGSETAVVELAARLARRGHDVTVYAPIRDGCPEYDRGARWLPLDAADFSRPGLWALSRCPRILDRFPADHPGQFTVLICQDVFYPPKLEREGLTDERIARLDVCSPLCTDQEKYLVEVSPSLAGKTRLSSNGIKVDLIERIEAKGQQCDWCYDGEELTGCDHCSHEGWSDIPRDPFKLISTSSPDRALPSLLRIFRRAREFEPRLKLSAAYGWDNIEKCKGKYWLNVRRECDKLMCDGVTWLGRMGQEALYREFLSASIWCYPTTFTETSCISCMEAQALGCIPITNPIWALRDNVRHGTFIEGDPADDPLVRLTYAAEVLRLARDHDLQESIRVPMMRWAREKFDWERVVDRYEEMMDARRVLDRGRQGQVCVP